MSVEAFCPNCRAFLNLKDTHVGHKVRCKTCEHVFTVGGQARSGTGSAITTTRDADTRKPTWTEDADAVRKRSQLEDEALTGQRGEDEDGLRKTARQRSREEKEPDSGRTSLPDQEGRPAAPKKAKRKQKSGAKVGLLIGLGTGAAHGSEPLARL
jgi:hypothetical protein